MSNMGLPCILMSILCLLGHKVSDMFITWQWVSILCSKGQGYLLCASQDRGVYSVPPGTQGLICASHGSGCLLCAQQGRDLYCVMLMTEVSILCLLGHRVSNTCIKCMLMSFRCLLGHRVSYMCLTKQCVSILCPTGQGCLLCVSWDTGGSNTFCKEQWWSIGCVRGQKVPNMCAREQGFLLSVPQGRGIYCVPYWTGVSILCFLGHRVSNMSLTWQWVCFLCTTGQGCLFCAFWSTVSVICASHGSGCLICAQPGSDIYCVIHRTGVSILWFQGHKVSNMCLTREGVFIMGLTGQGYLLCASRDRGVYSVPPGTQGI